MYIIIYTHHATRAFLSFIFYKEQVQTQSR